jgi:predicted DCC family thiol-disulfide oxidoreductase YuxK
MPHPIILYDGVCGLCNRFVQFIIRRDGDGVFRFASLQSSLAARILARHAVAPATLDTVYVVLDYELPRESLLSRSDAAIFVLKQLGGSLRPVALSLQLLPKFLRDIYYNIIARHRYRIFGRFDTCPIPSDQDRTRFLDG